MILIRKIVFGIICLSGKEEMVDFNPISLLFYPHSKVVAQTMISQEGCFNAHQHVPYGKKDFTKGSGT